VSPIKGVAGLAGLFFNAEDPKALYAWLAMHFGIERGEGSGAFFRWRDANHPEQEGMTVWFIFPRTTKYFEPSHAGFMMNFRVDNLDALLETFIAECVEVDSHSEDYE
jgi:hypothetical protein